MILNYSDYPDHEFNKECLNAKNKIRSMVNSDEILVKVYALIKEAIDEIQEEAISILATSLLMGPLIIPFMIFKKRALSRREYIKK